MTDRFVRVLITVLAAASGIAGAESVSVLKNGDILSWKERSFEGRTDYSTVTLDGRPVLRAASSGSASGVFRKVRVDIAKTPILHWSWRLEEGLESIDERTRKGDDYSARLYVIRKHPLFFWMTKAVNYVWSSALSKGETWTNAYTNSVRMVAIRSGNSEAGRWIHERRDVRTDFLKLFGMHVRYIDAVAVMTDTDNSGGDATAYYGDIHFASE